MTTGALLGSADFRVADLSLAEFGRNEIRLANARPASVDSTPIITRVPRLKAMKP